jgi:hypothetical protein
MPIAETPLEQLEVAVATYWTVVLTLLPLEGALTETLPEATLAETSVAEHTASNRGNFHMSTLHVG